MLVALIMMPLLASAMPHRLAAFQYEAADGRVAVPAAGAVAGDAGVWRRTTRGWERMDRWTLASSERVSDVEQDRSPEPCSATASVRPVPHPLAVAAAQLMISIAALLVVPCHRAWCSELPA